MTTEQSNVAETPYVDIVKLGDGRVLEADGSDAGISFEYQKISNSKGRIDYAGVEAGVEIEGHIDLTFTTEDGGYFELTQGEAVESGVFLIKASEATPDFAPAVISGKTLTMTTEQSNVAETPFVDIYKLISDGRVLGADGSDTGLSFEYQKISNLKGRIDYALVQDGVELEGRIDLTFTTEDGGDFELTQGEAVESGVFLIETP